MPAGWYEDPAKVGELRYFDGQRWTEHVTIGGVQTTAAYEPAEESPPPSFTMRRGAQSRSDDEQALTVIGISGAIGSYVPTLDGAPGYRLEDPQGGTVLTVSKPSLKSAVEVADPAGAPVCTIRKVGRLHARYEIQQPGREELSNVKLAPGATDRWQLQLGGGPAATFTRATSSPAVALNLAAVE